MEQAITDKEKAIVYDSYTAGVRAALFSFANAAGDELLSVIGTKPLNHKQATALIEKIVARCLEEIPSLMRGEEES